MHNRKILSPSFFLAATVAILFLVAVSAPVLAGENPDVAKLMRIIETQQKQLEAQQKQLDAQRKLLQEIQAQIADSPEKPATSASVAAVKNKPAEVPPEKVVTSGGGERVKLAISGHVNRMVSFIDDGKRSDTYFVDNDASESQIRFVGTAEATDDLTLGGIIEFSVAPNKSGNLDQRNQEENNIFDQRRTEITLDSKKWGQLSLGKGFTASYGTGAVDLSRTNVISYATLVDLAGSVLFRDSSSGDLTDVRIFQAFNSFDGLSRQNRLRYDTPNLAGFSLAASAISDDRYDAALRWGGKGYGLKAAGAVAVADPNQDNADLQYNGSFSVLHEDTGLNATASVGLLERTKQDDQQNYFFKVGWINQFFSVGDTAFSVDYTRSRNLPTDDDDGYSVAAAAVQHFDKYGTELFGVYRLHSLDRDVEANVDDIDVFAVGARVKF
jgi:predicted porin